MEVKNALKTLLFVIFSDNYLSELSIKKQRIYLSFRIVLCYFALLYVYYIGEVSLSSIIATSIMAMAYILYFMFSAKPCRPVTSFRGYALKLVALVVAIGIAGLALDVTDTLLFFTSMLFIGGYASLSILAEWLYMKQN